MPSSPMGMGLNTANSPRQTTHHDRLSTLEIQLTDALQRISELEKAMSRVIDVTGINR